MLNLHFDTFPVLETPRLVLRELTPDDIQQVFNLRNDEVVNRYLERSRARTPEDARDFIQKIISSNPGNEWLYWAIGFRNTNTLIGTISLFTISSEHENAEIGYELLPDFHGKGIMQEAISTIISYAFTMLKMSEIKASVHPGNIPSVRLLRRNHFEKNVQICKVTESYEILESYSLNRKTWILNIPEGNTCRK